MFKVILIIFLFLMQTFEAIQTFTQGRALSRISYNRYIVYIVVKINIKIVII